MSSKLAIDSDLYAGNPSAAVFSLSQYQPNALAVVTQQKSLTYRQLDQLVDAAQHYMHENLADQDQPIGLLFQSQLLMLVFSIASIRHGRPQLILHPRQNHSSRKTILSDAGSSDLFTDFELGELPHVSIHHINSMKALSENGGRSHPHFDWSQRTLAMLFLGSGTTGEPKIICHDVASLFDMVKRDVRARPISARDRHLSLTRVNYFTALRRSFAALVSFGVVGLSESELLANQVREFCNIFAIDHLSIVEIHAQGLLRSSADKTLMLPDLKSIIIGASPVSEKTRQKIISTINPNLYIGYGANEFGEAVVLTTSAQCAEKHGSIGYPCEGVDLRIVDKSGVDASVGETGKIQLRSTFPFYGYLHDTTDSTEKNGGAWWDTGDLGFRIESGEVYYAGRSDDMMIFNGINIHPREIEAVFEDHPAVLEVAVVSFWTERHGGVPIAVIVPRKNESDEKSLLQYGFEKLGTKAPQKIIFIDKMPRNAAGKILRTSLRASLKSNKEA